MCCYPHILFLSELPTPHITYNITSLCFSTNSSKNVTIEYTLSRDGLPDSMPKQLNGSCIDDPFLGVCTKFNVTALAMNAVGNSTSSKTFFSNDCGGKL